MIKRATEKPRVGLPDGWRFTKFGDTSGVVQPWIAGPMPIAFWCAYAGPDGLIARLFVSAGRLTSVSFEGSVTSRRLHAIPLATLERDAIGRIREAATAVRAAIGPDDPDEKFLRFRSSQLDAAATIPRRVTSDLHYVQIAGRYVELCATTAAPTKVLAQELFKSEGTIRDRLEEARNRGLLTAAPKGRAGGELTERAYGVIMRELARREIEGDD